MAHASASFLARDFHHFSLQEGRLGEEDPCVSLHCFPSCMPALPTQQFSASASLTRASSLCNRRDPPTWEHLQLFMHGICDHLEEEEHAKGLRQDRTFPDRFGRMVWFFCAGSRFLPRSPVFSPPPPPPPSLYYHLPCRSFIPSGSFTGSPGCVADFTPFPSTATTARVRTYHLPGFTTTLALSPATSSFTTTAAVHHTYLPPPTTTIRLRLWYAILRAFARTFTPPLAAARRAPPLPRAFCLHSPVPRTFAGLYLFAPRLPFYYATTPARDTAASSPPSSRHHAVGSPFRCLPHLLRAATPHTPAVRCAIPRTLFTAPPCTCRARASTTGFAAFTRTRCTLRTYAATHHTHTSLTTGPLPFAHACSSLSATAYITYKTFPWHCSMCILCIFIFGMVLMTMPWAGSVCEKHCVLCMCIDPLKKNLLSPLQTRR